MEFKWGESTQSDPWRIASCCYTDAYVYKYHGSHQQIKSPRAEKPLPIKWYIDLHETAVAWVNEPGKIIPLLLQSDCSQREKRRKTHILFPSWFGGKKVKTLIYSLFLLPSVFHKAVPYILYWALRQHLISLLLQFVPNLSFANDIISEVKAISQDS